MDQITPRAAARILRFLTEESVVWVSTVRPDGGPHIVPIWFWWDGEAILLFSKPDAQKVRNLRAKTSVMLALGEADDDFDVGMIRGRAELLSRPTSEVMPPAHLEKYRERMAAIGLGADEYAATYSQVIKIVPQDFLGWHGRTVPRSERIAGAPARSIAEPVNPAASETGGEPISDRTPGRAEAPARDRSPLSDGRMQPADALRAWLRRLSAAPLAPGNGGA